MIFTSEDGKKYEGSATLEGFIVYPVKQQPKWEVSVKDVDKIDIYFFDEHPTEDQAQLIKEAIEALMGQIHREHHVDEYSELDEAMDKARHSMRENN